MSTNFSKKLLLDTDIGSDIDDAVALAYLLSQPHCELVGITTVSGEAEKRAMLASILCRKVGKDIPIYPGIENPLVISQKQPNAQHASKLVNWDHSNSFPRGKAIEFLRDTIHKNPGEITLLGIGPLTNIAILFSLDPEIPSLLKELVLMCGVFTNRVIGPGPCDAREWNAQVDPHAAAIVYSAPVKIHRSIGLDVTCQVQMDAQEVKKKFTSPILQPVADFAEVWFSQMKEPITFHDPLAAVTIFDDKVCEFEKGKVDIELTSERLQGMTYWDYGESKEAKHEVATKVDKERFFKEYFEVTSLIS